MNKRGQNRSFSLCNFSSKNHKGLSTIIITLILIVVSLVAIAIFWVVVRNLLQTGTEGIGLGRYTLSGNIKNVNLDNSTNNVSLTVERNPGQGEISGVEFIFSDGTDSEVVKETISMKELESRKFYFHLTKLNVSNLKSISIAFLIKENDKETLGDVVDKYNVAEGTGGGGTTGGTCSPATCTSLGYECGNWNNGTCGGTLNCGSCGTGQTCNANGICQSGSCTPATCTSLGYQCGSGYANGTCSGTLNCGTCSGGQSCNASGICVGCVPASNPCGTAVCGNVANGTCGQISCGSCPGGQSCIGGSCVVPTGNTYWVSSTGTASWANCRSPTPLSGSSACSYSTANSNAAPGDIVYYRGGTYSGITGSAINPTNTGTAGNMITFSSYNNEDVQFVGSGLSSTAVNLDSEYGTVRSYIKVNDLHFTHFERHLWIRRGSHNEIASCSFIGYPTEATSSSNLEWSGSYIYRQATYNWVHNNTFGIYGWCQPYGTDYGVVFQVGLETSTTDLSQHNLIEYNEMYSGGHHVVSLNGKYNIYRGNYFHNEPWCPLGSPTYATRTMFQTGADGDGQYNLVEGNRFGYGGPKNKDEIGGAGGTMAGAYNIWRRNEFVQIYTDAQYVTKYSGQTDVKYNHVYNNVYWHSGYGTYQQNVSNWENRYTHAIVVEEGSTGGGVYGNVFKNNIFYQNRDLLGTQYSIISRYYDSGQGWVTRVPIFQVISNNWFDNAGDPGFIDISGTPDPMNKNQFNLHLQSGSPCINAGAYLTNITSATGSGTSFTVIDAGYFMDGWGVISGDTIQLAGQTQTARITNIDYTTNTITVNSALSWTQGQGIGLAYNGNAPDLGAYEYS